MVGRVTEMCGRADRVDLAQWWWLTPRLRKWNIRATVYWRGGDISPTIAIWSEVERARLPGSAWRRCSVDCWRAAARWRGKRRVGASRQLVLGKMRIQGRGSQWTRTRRRVAVVLFCRTSRVRRLLLEGPGRIPVAIIIVRIADDKNPVAWP